MASRMLKHVLSNGLVGILLLTGMAQEAMAVVVLTQVGAEVKIKKLRYMTEDPEMASFTYYSMHINNSTALETSQPGGRPPGYHQVLTLDQEIDCGLTSPTNKIIVRPYLDYKYDLSKVTYSLENTEQTTTIINNAYTSGATLRINTATQVKKATYYTAYAACIVRLDDLDIIPAAGGSSSSSESASTLPTSWINGVIVKDGTDPESPVSTTWGFDIASEGDYEVSVHWVSNHNTVTDVALTFDGGAKTPSSLDQNISSGIWVKMNANKHFTAGPHNVKIDVDPTAFYVVDGIKVERIQ